MNHSVRLCHLYPNEMNIYADRGNIAVLAKRLQWRAMSLEITPCHVKQTVNPKDFDIFYLGGGQDSDQAVITKDLQETKAGALREAFELGAVGLFVCGGYQLAGYSYETKEHGQLDGLGLLDITTVTGETRLIGDILIEVELGTQPENTQPNNPQPDNPRPLQIVGYENHLGRTFLGPHTKALGKVIKGHGNNGQDNTEGAIQNHIIGTYLHGPLLPKNPQLADLILSWALGYRYGSDSTASLLPPIDDSWERTAHSTALRRAKASKRKRGNPLGGKIIPKQNLHR